MAAGAKIKHKLIIFDIDGTLITCRDAGGATSWTRQHLAPIVGHVANKQVFARPYALEILQYFLTNDQAIGTLKWSKDAEEEIVYTWCVVFSAARRSWVELILPALFSIRPGLFLKVLTAEDCEMDYTATVPIRKNIQRVLEHPSIQLLGIELDDIVILEDQPEVYTGYAGCPSSLEDRILMLQGAYHSGTHGPHIVAVNSYRVEDVEREENIYTSKIAGSLTLENALCRCASALKISAQCVDRYLERNMFDSVYQINADEEEEENQFKEQEESNPFDAAKAQQPPQPTLSNNGYCDMQARPCAIM